MTWDDCRDACNSKANMDSHGRQCAAYQVHGKSSEITRCSLAWTCDYIKPLPPGIFLNTYKKIGNDYVLGIILS